jgi:tRNA(fMet)-specific endonuclease VapC
VASILLDTNAVIAVLNDRPSAVRERLRLALEVGEEIGLSSVVVFELRYGAERSARPDQNHARIDDLLAGPLRVLELTAADAAEAGVVRAELEARGTPIGPFDVLIAGQARARGVRLVTANLREFDRVERLKVESWA